MLKKPTYNIAYESFETDLKLSHLIGSGALKTTACGWKLTTGSRTYSIDSRNLAIRVVNRVVGAVSGSLGYTESYTLSLSKRTIQGYLRNLH